MFIICEKEEYAMSEYYAVVLVNNKYCTRWNYQYDDDRDNFAIKDCCFYSEVTKSKLFGVIPLEEKVKASFAMPIFCKKTSEGYLKDIITGEIYVKEGSYSDELKAQMQLFIEYRYANKVSPTFVAHILKKYFNNEYLEENIKRYRSIINCIRIDNETLVYKNICKGKINQITNSECIDYIENFMKNI